MYEIQATGRICEVGATRQGTSQSGRAWFCQSYVMEHINGSYTDYLEFELWGEDKNRELALAKGDTVSGRFSVSSRYSKTGRWFTGVTAQNIGKVAAPAPAPAPTPAPAPAPAEHLGPQNDGLPF